MYKYLILILVVLVSNSWPVMAQKTILQRPDEPFIVSFSPTGGETFTVVNIYGRNFTHTTAVKFNGMNAKYIIKSDTQITTYVPQNAGTGKISVIKDSGSTNSSLEFAYIKWMFNIDPEIVSNPAISKDGTIYCTASGKLYAMNSDGTLKWVCNDNKGNMNDYPAIGSDGTIYCLGSGADGGILYAINSSGTIKWTCKGKWTRMVNLAISNDETIYFVDNYSLFAINSNGSIKWSYDSPGQLSGISIARDGTIYVPTGYHAPGDAKVYAFNPDGTVKWTFSLRTPGSWTRPAIGSDGTVYIWTHKLLRDLAYEKQLGALNPDNGNLKWIYNSGGKDLYSSLSIGHQDTIYEVGNRKLYSINSDGSLQWSCAIGNSWFYSSPTIAEDGTIYLGDSGDDQYKSPKFYGLYADGGQKIVLDVVSGTNSPAIGDDGTIYLPAKRLYAISGSSPLAKSSWPKFNKNNQNTGQH